MTAAVRFPVWGTTAALLVAEPAGVVVARRALLAELGAMGRACDRFRPGSDLSRLNAAGGRPVLVSALFRRTLAEALRVAEATEGRVDPTVGTALIGLGYDRDFGELPADGPAPDPRPAAGWHTVTVDTSRGTVRIPPGERLDLGAVAKAFAADRAAARAAEAAGCGVLVSLGGDIAAAGPAPGDGWHVGVSDDHRVAPDTAGQRVAISSGGLATSSVTVRRWRRGGAWMHHILDPADGRPVRSCWRTASVAAASCVDANGASTAALVLGEEAPDWLRDLALPGRLVRADGEVCTVAGWPEDRRAAA
jgi:thiamine biosynthesis lipoprotein